MLMSYRLIWRNAINTLAEAFVLMVLFAFAFCNGIAQADICTNEDIPQEVLNEMEPRIVALDQAIAQGNLSLISNYYGNMMSYNVEVLERIIEIIRDEYISSRTTFLRVYIPSTENFLDIHELTDDMYLLIPENYQDKDLYLDIVSFGTDVSQNIFLSVWCMEDDWKLYYVNYNPYAFHGMNAQGMYDMLEKLNAEGKQLSALVFTSALDSISSPCADFLQYKNIEAINAFADDLKDTHYVIIGKCRDICLANSTEELLDAGGIILKEGVVPVIMYQENADLTGLSDDSIEQKIFSVVEQYSLLFSGFPLDFRYVIVMPYAKSREGEVTRICTMGIMGGDIISFQMD